MDSKEIDHLSKMLGRIESELSHLSETIKEIKVQLNHDVQRLEKRVTRLEEQNQRLHGMFAVGAFMIAFIIPIIQKKLGF